MSEHKTKLNWKRKDSGFGYKEFPRGHEWGFPRSGQTLRASAAPEYLGDADRADPEEAFTAALTSCHMLTFLAVAERKGLAVTAYEDDAVGYLGKDERGRMAVVRVELRPRITFAGEAPDEAAMASLHKRAHRGCFLANSVRSEVVVLDT